MLIHERFQIDYEAGSIEVQLDFRLDGKAIDVTNIKIHGTFDSRLPSAPSFENHDGKYFLVAHFINENGRKAFERITGNKYADDIINEIQKRKNDVTSK